MTSTNIFTGLTSAKNSSKVLKPPGGGHTDIFGAPDPPVKKNSGRNASSILEGTNTEKPTTPVKTTPSPPQINPPPVVTESAAPPRNRVPPGGYSSGPLW